MPVLGKLQENCLKSEVSLGYIDLPGLHGESLFTHMNSSNPSS